MLPGAFSWRVDLFFWAFLCVFCTHSGLGICRLNELNSLLSLSTQHICVFMFECPRGTVIPHCPFNTHRDTHTLEESCKWPLCWWRLWVSTLGHVCYLSLRATQLQSVWQSRPNSGLLGGGILGQVHTASHTHTHTNKLKDWWTDVGTSLCGPQERGWVSAHQTWNNSKNKSASNKRDPVGVGSASTVGGTLSILSAQTWTRGFVGLHTNHVFFTFFKKIRMTVINTQTIVSFRHQTLFRSSNLSSWDGEKHRRPQSDTDDYAGRLWIRASISKGSLWRASRVPGPLSVQLVEGSSQCQTAVHHPAFTKISHNHGRVVHQWKEDKKLHPTTTNQIVMYPNLLSVLSGFLSNNNQLNCHVPEPSSWFILLWILPLVSHLILQRPSSALPAAHNALHYSEL